MANPIKATIDLQRNGAKPVEHQAANDGIIIGRHFPSLVKVDGFINVIAKTDQ